jgi:hypothetical protein
MHNASPFPTVGPYAKADIKPKRVFSCKRPPEHASSPRCKPFHGNVIGSGAESFTSLVASAHGLFRERSPVMRLARVVLVTREQERAKLSEFKDSTAWRWAGEMVQIKVVLWENKHSTRQNAPKNRQCY